jgi:hypothetical protein
MPIRVRTVNGFVVITIGLLAMEPPRGYVVGLLGALLVLQAAYDARRGRS